MQLVDYELLKGKLDTSKLDSLAMLSNEDARKKLGLIWEQSPESLRDFFGIFLNKTNKEVFDLIYLTFISMAFKSHGYVDITESTIDIKEIEEQYKIDLEIINRESGWNDNHAIVFHKWWPEPTWDEDRQRIQFGVILGDKEGNIINKTINRIILTRFGHIEMNYSLSEEDVKKNRDVSFYLGKLDEAEGALSIDNGYMYKDIDKDIDPQSKSKITNLILSAELF